ncbi:sugar phosphate isomerase/epimerase [Paenibacillus sp. S150]|uniref:sugar phosphate isomerase/epimerase family protein n=1 Tax=Paenibacillus sp. S150 TaxID=2749826 RepID=UPI001C5A1B03|nr:sugar phosphate isomerase/epimerase [Paenibacillus sp. S150]MBW4079814.1 sugar phosphate isomerase/epimerase [Paenibacillus sp. S150]
MELTIGLQLFSVREELKKDFHGTLRKLAEIGYKNLEIAIHNSSEGLQAGGGLPPGEARRVIEDLGMKIVSTHIFPIDSVAWEDLIAFNQEVGSTSIVCPISFFTSKADVLQFCLDMNRYGEQAQKIGIDFYYHNHFHEFQKIDDQPIMDMILEHTDKDLVKIEFDTYWALRGGADPVAYLQKLGTRCDKIHQKDLPATVLPANLLETIDNTELLTHPQFMALRNPAYFTEIGDGMMDIPGILAAVREIGAAQYIFVEQDLTAINELDSVERSYRNLKELMK